MDEINTHYDELKLLSINQTRKILGVRYETVKMLVKTGKIKAVTTVNNKIKIPYRNLLEYIKGDQVTPKNDNGIIPIEEIQKQIDSLINDYSKE